MVLSVSTRKIPVTDATGIRSRNPTTSSTLLCYPRLPWKRVESQILERNSFCEYLWQQEKYFADKQLPWFTFIFRHIIGNSERNLQNSSIYYLNGIFRKVEQAELKPSGNTSQQYLQIHLQNNYLDRKNETGY